MLRDVSSAVTKYVQRTRQPGVADLVGYKGPHTYCSDSTGSEAPDKASPTIHHLRASRICTMYHVSPARERTHRHTFVREGGRGISKRSGILRADGRWMDFGAASEVAYASPLLVGSRIFLAPESLVACHLGPFDAVLATFSPCGRRRG